MVRFTAPEGASFLVLFATAALVSIAQPRSAVDDAIALDAAVAAASIGGAVVLSMPQEPHPIDPKPVGESDWWAYCSETSNCIASAEENNGLGCPSSYMLLGVGPQRCFPRTCVTSCTVNHPSGLCKFAWTSDCIDTTLTRSPGNCGAGSTGKCSYTGQWHDGTGWTTCTSSGLCNRDGGAVTCGVAHTCTTVD